MSKEATARSAMKLALEALEYIRNIETDVVSQIKYGNASQIIEEALEKPDFWEGYVPEPVKPAPVQDNPLDCGVHLGSGKDHEIKNHVSYGPEQPMPDAFEQLMREADKPTQVLQQGVAEYVDALIKGTHEITSLTIRPKRTWQGLTQDEIADLAEHYYEDKVVQVEEAIEMAEAKLRSKNDL